MSQKAIIINVTEFKKFNMNRFKINKMCNK